MERTWGARGLESRDELGRAETKRRWLTRDNLGCRVVLTGLGAVMDGPACRKVVFRRGLV